MTLNVFQQRFLVRCLRMAAAEFDKEAKPVRGKSLGRNLTRSLRTLTHWTADAHALADLIEAAQTVEVKP